MANLIPKNEATLRTIMRLKEAGVHEVNAAIGEDSRNAIRSLLRCEYIHVTRSVMRKTKPIDKTHRTYAREMLLYAITEKGREKLKDAGSSLARQTKALKAPPREIKAPLNPEPLKQEQHKMQDFVIPDFPPGETQMVIEVDGVQVKCARGVEFKRDKYVPPVDNSRNYTPRPIKGIHAL